MRVGNRAAGTCVVSSPDSDLEAFSDNPAHGISRMCRPSQTPHLTMSSARIDPPKRVLGLKEGVVTPPQIHGSFHKAVLESSSTGSSFHADSAKPVPLAVVLLDSRQGQWESR
ncbi:hypothetical protein YC2023_108582 [Brassica napus]